jgi:hypothetical protein
VGSIIPRRKKLLIATCPRILMLLLALAAGRSLSAEQRHQSFDKNPRWESHNCRPAVEAGRQVKQDFGFSFTRHAGGKGAGELGGFIHPAAEPASYARRIPRKTLNDKLTASGTVKCTGRQFHVVVGFFNSNTLNEWRTPNTISLRLYGRGDVFYAFVEYATSRWRAGGDNPQPFPFVIDPGTGRREQSGFTSNTAHRWSLTYDPQGNDGAGVVTATIDEATAICHLDLGHKQDGATFNRCGLMTVMKHWDDGGELWLDDITINGKTEHFDRDPGWESFQNRRDYLSTNVRPRFDFGYSPTRYAGGRGRGELGGLVFRGDCRYADRMAYYADRLHDLSLDQPLTAAGTIALRRGVTDSTTLIGFFHSTRSMEVNDSQSSTIPNDFLGLAVEGPSRDGFFVYPLYRVNGAAQGSAGGDDRPHILPNGRSHNWRLDYAPAAASGRGRIAVTLDRKTTVLDLREGHRPGGARFNRFGIITTWIDGNGQHIYFDDLTYTASQE